VYVIIAYENFQYLDALSRERTIFSFSF